jgi:hypothetical protein
MCHADVQWPRRMGDRAARPGNKAAQLSPSHEAGPKGLNGNARAYHSTRRRAQPGQGISPTSLTFAFVAAGSTDCTVAAPNSGPRRCHCFLVPDRWPRI